MFNIKQLETIKITQRKRSGMLKQVPHTATGDKTHTHARFPILSFPACISMQIGFPKMSADGHKT